MVRKNVTVDVFRAVADPTRRELLDRLAEEEQPVMALAESFDMSLPAVSQHLKLLREAGLVTERREGRQRIYTLTAGPLREVADWVSHYDRFWRIKLKNLGEHLKRNP
jgi:DNA-binding transcriptional ArsR family regulator